MDQRLLVAVVVGIFVVIVIAAVWPMRVRRTRRLRARFGPEYDRVVLEAGGVRQAEGVLEFREKRRDRFVIHPLSASDRAGYQTKWDEVQNRFVDDPSQAVATADRLVNEV